MMSSAPIKHSVNTTSRLRFERLRPCVAAMSFTLLVGALPSFGDDERLPTGERVISQFVEATGGEQAYRKLRNRVSKGKLELVGAGVTGVVTAYQSVPSKLYTIVESEALGSIEFGTDGTVVWEKSMMTGPSVKEGSERAVTLRESVFHRPLGWKRLYKSAECVAIVDLNGAKCHKVVMTPNEGNPETRYYDTTSHLLIRTDTKADTVVGTYPMKTLYEDYKAVDGIKVAHKTTQEITGVQTIMTVMEKIEHNSEIPKDRFKLPAEIQEILAVETP